VPIAPASFCVPCTLQKEKAITLFQNHTIAIIHTKEIAIINNKILFAINKAYSKKNSEDKICKNFESHTFCDFNMTSNRISAILQLL